MSDQPTTKTTLETIPLSKMAMRAFTNEARRHLSENESIAAEAAADIGLDLREGWQIDLSLRMWTRPVASPEPTPPAPAAPALSLEQGGRADVTGFDHSDNGGPT